MDKPPLVELIDVAVRNDRGGMVFRDLNFVLPAERSAVITGAAGAGKTLLAELLIGLRFAESGTVRLFDRELRPAKNRLIRRVRRQIGGVGGQFGLAPTLTVSENITLPMVIAGERKKVQRERLRKMLAEFSLLKQAGELPGSLTRVENSLVQFARASVANQPLMIIDEPSAGLDPKTFLRVFEFLVRVSVSGRSMVILVSETPGQKMPNTDYYRISDGALV
ncbi:MAG TPA: ATP-binding cassette domain-containing protein [Acidobacteriota bacterium]|nr:ATP-binding cassette domain-containing protein [Acidobacteriota bacterium]